MGWNSWNKFACDISESLIKETADALVESGLAAAGYNYLNLDDCWQAAERNADGTISANSTRFPAGLKALGDYIHSKGLKFGIYSSAGFKTCQGFPAGLGREAIDVASYAEWGVDYLKYDNCYEDRGSPEKRFQAMGDALSALQKQKNSNEDKKNRDSGIFFSLCEWGRENPAVWASAVAGGDSWRISPDITDGWLSILSRAAISSSLWRFAGPGVGWNDPDMLEVGNGGCSLAQYRSHFSLWAMLKAPLILGNDIRNVTADADVFEIISNAEVIAVNQDKLGMQARITWSDVSDQLSAVAGGDKLIATKCAKNAATAAVAVAVEGVRAAYTVEDDPLDQQWIFQEDGRIRSATTGHCLHESDDFSISSSATSDIFSTDEFMGTDMTAMLNFTSPVRAVTTADCSAVDTTQWKTEQFLGGSIVSAASGLCLEVNKFEFYPSAQGKRIQTAPCQDTIPDDKNHRNGNNYNYNINNDVNDKGYLDIREHQSWTAPEGAQQSRLLNLYQRQCLTVDRDAYSGMQLEVWTSLLEEDAAMAVLLLNKGPTPRELTLSMAMLGQLGQLYAEDISFTMRDLWEKKDLLRPFSSRHEVSFKIDGYNSILLKLTPQ